jgi:hypothetical protein
LDFGSGSIICGNCSKNRFLIEHVDARTPVRICDECYDELAVASLEKKNNPHTSVNRTVRRQSALLRMMIGEDGDASVAAVNGSRGEDEEDTGRETIIDFGKYKEEIDSVRAMTLTVDAPASGSGVRRASAVNVPQWVPEESDCKPDSAAARTTKSDVISTSSISSVKANAGSFDGRAPVTASITTLQSTLQNLGPNVCTDDVTIEMASDYSSEDSDYEYTTDSSPAASCGNPASAKSPRKSRKTRLLKLEDIASLTDAVGDTIPRESSPLDPHYSKKLSGSPIVSPPPLPAKPGVTSVRFSSDSNQVPQPDAVIGSPCATGTNSSPSASPLMPPPKPPRRSGNLSSTSPM